MFPSEFSEISKNTFFTEHLWATALVSDVNLCIFNGVNYSNYFCKCSFKKANSFNEIKQKVTSKN